MPRFIVQTAMPTGYTRTIRIEMLSTSTRPVVRIVYESEPLDSGYGGPNTDAAKMRRAATRVVERLNNSLAVLALQASKDDDAMTSYVRQLIHDDRGD
jgi:hypothetical protein